MLSAVGCAASVKTVGTKGNRIPPYPAGSSLPRWEQFCAGIDGSVGATDAVAKLLNDAGKNGWELILVTEGGAFCFKRQLASSSEAAVAATP